MEELGLTPDTIDEIQRVPYETLADAWKRAAARLSAEGVSVDWSPIPNAEYPGDPMSVGFSEKAKHTPLIVGGVVAEQLLWRGKIYDPADPTGDKLRRVREFYGEGADTMLAEFEKAYPDKDLNDLMYVDSRFRKPAIDYIAARVQVAKAPTYSWMLTYDFPIYGGLPAWHGSNHALTFNQCIAPVFHEPGSQRLAVQMSRSYAAFAHTGDPNNFEIPAWHPCEPGREAVMCFDAVCEEKINYDHALMSAHAKYAPPLNLRPKFKGCRSSKQRCLNGSAVCFSLSKKSLTDFFDKLQPPSILLRAKCYYPKSPDFSRLFGRRFIQLEAGLAPSSSPAALSSFMSAGFLTVSSKQRCLNGSAVCF